MYSLSTICAILFSIVCVGCSMPSINVESTTGYPTDKLGTTANAQHPHIVLLLADDLGVDAFSCPVGSQYLPNLSALCEVGAYFSRAYAAPYCTPSRASLLTGRYAFRHGANDVAREQLKLPLSEVTIPEMLREHASEYNSSAFGKWHLADDENGNALNPNLQGFAHYEGTPRQTGLYKYFNYPWFENGEFAGEKSVYRVTQTVDAAINYFAEVHNDAPQFMYVGFVSPHIPFHRPPQHLTTIHLDQAAPRPTRDEPPPNGFYRVFRRDENLDPYYFAMLEAVDAEIHRLVIELNNRSNRPIVFIFAGDNGSASEVSTWPLNGPYRAKTSLYEGGIRVPLLVWSTDTLSVKSGIRSELISIVDLFATVLELSGVKDISTVPQILDAFSFADQLAGSARPRPEPIYVQGGNARAQQFRYAAISESGLKLIVSEKIDGTDRRSRSYTDGLVEAYDVVEDPAEAKNLIRNCDFSPSPLLDLLDFMQAKRLSEPHPKDDRFDYSAYHQFIKNRSRECIDEVASADHPVDPE